MHNCKNMPLADKLTKTAKGEAYYGEALSTIKVLFSLTQKEKDCIHRYLGGLQQGTDHITLQDIANKLES